MKVKVRIKVEWSSLSHEAIGLKIVYKTSRQLLKREIDIARYYELFSCEQEPFIVQLANFVSKGNLQERICNMVKRDIIRELEENRASKTSDDRLWDLILFLMYLLEKME